MLIREYCEDDLDALRAIHAAQGFDYALPDLRNPLFITKLVLSTGDAANTGVAAGFSPPSGDASYEAALSPGQENLPRKGSELKTDNGLTEGNCQILGAVLLRLTAEAYLLLDPRTGSPRERWQSLLALHEAARRDAWQRGLEDVHAWLPPPIAKKFGRRLERLGWRRDDSWTPYCKRLYGQ